ncbi:MAG: hypothetical protein ACLFNL_07415 [Bacteroidales bacterium]
MKYCLKILVFLLLSVSLFSLTNCSLLQKPVSKEERSAKVNNSIEKKHSDKREKAREEFRKMHYKRQAPSTKKRMDYNARMAETWRQENLRSENPGLWKKIKLWIETQYRKIKPRDKGLYRKNIKD